MKSNSHVRRTFILLAGVAALAACVQQPTTDRSESGEAVTAERASLFTAQVESLQRYTTQMEKLYAEQEAEILRLRRQAASVTPSR
jgi:hypothetical protein